MFGLLAAPVKALPVVLLAAVALTLSGLPSVCAQELARLRSEDPSCHTRHRVGAGAGEQRDPQPSEAGWPPLGLETPAPDELRLEELPLPKAHARALLYNPKLRSFAYEVRAREAAALQAGLLPNPVFGGEIEELGGTGPLAGLEGAEITVAITQPILLGGDRKRRRDVAALQRELASWDYRSVRLDVLTDVSRSFYEVLAEQRRSELAAELLRVARHVARTVSERVEAGKVSPIEKTRADVEAASAEIDHRRSLSELEAARVRLSATWGSAIPSFERAVGDLDELIAPPPYDDLDDRLEENPEWARWSTERRHRQAVIELEQALRIPDLELEGGMRRRRELDINAWVASISIPLPLFDRNQGALREARIRTRQAEADRRSVEAGLRASLTALYEQLTAAHAEALSWREVVLPAAEEVFEATEEGYREGKFDLLSVLDAQRTLFDVTNRLVEALALYHLLRTETERLVGLPLRADRENGGSRS